MDKKYIALFLILAIIFLEVYYHVFSAMITGLVSVALSIAEDAEVCLEFLDMPIKVTQNSNYNIRVGLHNCGSLKLNESALRFRVNNTHNRITTEFEKPVLNLLVDERRTEVITWSVTLDPGRYTMHVWSIYDNETSNKISSNFTVFSAPSPEPTVSSGYQVTKITNISLSYPQELNLTQDAEYVVLIKVTNTGDLDVHNLYLELESSGILTDVVFPGMQSVLEPDSSVIFTTNLTVPKELEPGDYPIDLLVYSDEINRTGQIIGKVRILNIKEKAKDLLLYYTDLLNRLEEEINIAEEEGKNLTTVRELFDDVSKELDVAKELFNLGLYSSSIEQLGIVRLKIIEVVRALIFAKTIEKPIIFPALPMIPCIVWVIGLIIIDSSLAVALKKKLSWIKIVLIMIGVSLLIVLLAESNCAIQIILSALITILIFILLVLIDRLKKEEPYLLRFRRW